MNPAHVPALVKAGLRFSGTDEAGQRMEIIELPQEIHPFFLATQCVCGPGRALSGVQIALPLAFA